MFDARIPNILELREYATQQLGGEGAAEGPRVEGCSGGKDGPVHGVNLMSQEGLQLPATLSVSLDSIEARAHGRHPKAASDVSADE